MMNFKKIREHYAPNEYPTNEWYRQHLERNYDTLIMGDGIAKTMTPPSLLGKRFNLALKNQTLAMDYRVLQQCFSILKPGGIVVFPLSQHTCYCGWRGTTDLRPYYWLFWPSDIARNPVELFYIRVAKRIPVILVRPWEVFTVSKPYNIHSEQKRQEKELKRFTDVDKKNGVENTLRLIDEIIKFCNERDIKPVFTFMPTDNGRNSIDEELKSTISKIASRYMMDWERINDL